VRAVNPTVVYASVTGFGQSGPYAQRPAYNTVAQGISGIMALTGMPDSPPTRVGGTITDVAAAFVALAAINAALVHRFRTGQGQQLDVSLLGSTLGLLPDVVAHYFDTGVRPGREGNRNPQVAPAEAFRTQDGHLNLVVMNRSQWDRLCRVLGDEELRTDPRFATNNSRIANRAEMVARIERVIVTAPTAEWIARLEAAAIPCGPIYEFDEVFNDPQVRYLGMLTEMEQPGYGHLRMLDLPFKASSAPKVVRRPAPQLGEHTTEVLEELRLERAEIERLAAAGTVMRGVGYD
jgi:crotonobetainyl-CoA:carnitine CoA-transferase CaiB-like acyl-CoA transferase